MKYAILFITIIVFFYVCVFRKKFRQYFHQSFEKYMYYKITGVFYKIKPCFITPRDFFSEDDPLFGKTNCSLVCYGDISNRSPVKFLYALSRGGQVISNVKRTNCYFSLDTAGYVDMLGLLVYCSDNKWIEFETYNIGDKIYFHDKEWELVEYVSTMKVAKITMLNKYKFCEDMKMKKSQRWIYFLQIIGFILVFSVSLATLLKT